MNADAAGIEELRAARRAFRAARHLLAAAVLANDDGALVAACWQVLRAGDDLARLDRQTARHERARRRWRRYALAGLNGRVLAGLDHRAHRLFNNHEEHQR